MVEDERGWHLITDIIECLTLESPHTYPLFSPHAHADYESRKMKKRILIILLHF